MLHNKFDTRRAFPKWYDRLALVLNGGKRITPGPSPSPEQGCTAPWTLSFRLALLTPTLRRQPLTPAHLPQPRRVEVLDRLRQHPQDAPHRRLDSGPPQSRCHLQVPAWSPRETSSVFAFKRIDCMSQPSSGRASTSHPCSEGSPVRSCDAPSPQRSAKHIPTKSTKPTTVSASSLLLTQTTSMQYAQQEDQLKQQYATPSTIGTRKTDLCFEHSAVQPALVRRPRKMCIRKEGRSCSKRGSR